MEPQLASPPYVPSDATLPPRPRAVVATVRGGADGLGGEPPLRWTVREDAPGEPGDLP